ncbi:quercetin dioxygenase-like cupin family protein [Pseudoduganella lurida]|uniref:Quercetin dioxygenase-like cupin family protein n=1 Tax=Pseudoduganella lurida TaxID=1036180 RepID=A0A562R1X4_9BURK|nr:cupin domain-containing protein [Pseudoduganella lurida]TWI63075.1 quercetin dioxygenase-like cupin family protein [Pseudoduganella lurida]
MALQHASSGQVIALQRSGEDGSQFSSIALAKTDDIELIRLVLPAGKSMPEHWVKGQITFQCLSGEIAFDAHGRTTTLRGGEMLYLEGAAPHGLTAVTDSVALLTIVLKD